MPSRRLVVAFLALWLTLGLVVFYGSVRTLLHALDGYSLDEIAGITGLSKDVVKKQLFKARRAIREQLQKKGGFQLPPCLFFLLL